MGISVLHHECHILLSCSDISKNEIRKYILLTMHIVNKFIAVTVLAYLVLGSPHIYKVRGFRHDRDDS